MGIIRGPDLKCLNFIQFINKSLDYQDTILSAEGHENLSLWCESIVVHDGFVPVRWNTARLYHFYLKVEVILLAVVYENFRTISALHYEINPSNTYSFPELIWHHDEKIDVETGTTTPHWSAFFHWI